MNFKQVEINEDEAFQLNILLPIVLILILFLVNALYFYHFFEESFIELLKIYLLFSFSIFSISIFFQLKNNYIKQYINLYKVGVFSSILVFIFLVSNFFFSSKIFETHIKYDKHYERNLLKYHIPIQMKHLYIFNQKDYRKYAMKNYVYNVQVNESYLGYLIVKKKHFYKIL